MSSKEKFDYYNSRFALIAVGNSAVVMELEEDGAIRELWPVAEFHKICVKDRVKVSGDEKPIPFSQIWMKSRRGRQYARLVYDMPGGHVRATEKDFNGYRGFTVQPAPGDWSLNRAHLLDVICQGDQERFHWVMNWLAALFQLPGRHAGSAIVLQSDKEGTGKGHFADEMVGKCFHRQQYLHLIGPGQIVAEFNEHFSGKVFVFADESVWGGDKAAAEKLKGLITEDTILIHRKYLKAIEEPSALHTIIASNNERPVAVSASDRRFMINEVSDTHRQDYAYFKALRQELAQGGRAAFLHELLQFPLDEALLRRPLETKAKLEIKARTFTEDDIWMQNWLMNHDGTWRPRVGKTALYQMYTQELHRRAVPRSHDGFGKMLKRKYGIDWESCKVSVPGGVDQETRVNGYAFLQGLAECRRLFDQAMGVQTDWPTDDCPGSPSEVGQVGQETLEFPE